MMLINESAAGKKNLYDFTNYVEDEATDRKFLRFTGISLWLDFLTGVTWIAQDFTGVRP